MAVVKELIRTEADGGISFGDYELAAKAKKLLDVYDDSIRMELKEYSVLLYNLYRSAKLEFTDEEQVCYYYYMLDKFRFYESTPAVVNETLEQYFQEFEEQGVIIAIDLDIHEVEEVTTCLALSPKRIARAAPESHLLRLERLGERFLIHVTEHEHILGHGILNNGRYETATFRKIYFHSVMSSYIVVCCCYFISFQQRLYIWVIKTI